MRDIHRVKKKESVDSVTKSSKKRENSLFFLCESAQSRPAVPRLKKKKKEKKTECFSFLVARCFVFVSLRQLSLPAWHRERASTDLDATLSLSSLLIGDKRRRFAPPRCREKKDEEEKNEKTLTSPSPPHTLPKPQKPPPLLPGPRRRRPPPHLRRPQQAPRLRPGKARPRRRWPGPPHPPAARVDRHRREVGRGASVTWI